MVLEGRVTGREAAAGRIMFGMKMLLERFTRYDPNSGPMVSGDMLDDWAY